MKVSHFIVSVLLFAAGFAGFMDSRFFILWGLFAAAFFYSFVLKRGLIVHTPKTVSTEADGLAHEIAVLQKQLEGILIENNVKSESELITMVKERDVMMQELVKLESKKEGILRSRRTETLEKERADLLRRIGIEESRISDEQKASPPTLADQRSLEMDAERLMKEEDRLRRESEQVSALVRASRADSEALAALEEEMEQVRERKARVERKVRVLELLAGALDEAQKKTIEKSRRAIEDYMHKYLLAITDGRYDNARVKDDLSFEVWSEEKKDMVVPEEHLSKGTIDQFYLIARFAVLDLLNRGVKSLVLLDDPFAGFDAKRRERAREMLTDMTDKFQIILCTHSSDYEGWGTLVEI